MDGTGTGACASMKMQHSELIARQQWLTVTLGTLKCCLHPASWQNAKNTTNGCQKKKKRNLQQNETSHGNSKAIVAASAISAKLAALPTVWRRKDSDAKHCQLMILCDGWALLPANKESEKSTKEKEKHENDIEKKKN